MQAGRLAYFSTPSEGGWLAYPLPALYTDPGLRAFRDWLPATCRGAKAQLSGSFVSSKIEDYYAAAVRQMKRAGIGRATT